MGDLSKENNNNFGINDNVIDITSIETWRSESIKGKVCGIVGCLMKPTSRCPICDNMYCYDHIKIHIHPASDLK